MVAPDNPETPMRLAALLLTLVTAVPSGAETFIAEASGNWAGASRQGFYFLARLSRAEDKLRLSIWGGALDGVPAGTGEPEFDNPAIELSAFATREALEVVEGPDGSILQVVVEFADEVWVLDYKSGSRAAIANGELEAQYRAQVEDYCLALRAVFPTKRVFGLIVFADGSRIALGQHGSVQS